jgi:hypothetical protein
MSSMERHASTEMSMLQHTERCRPEKLVLHVVHVKSPCFKKFPCSDPETKTV